MPPSSTDPSPFVVRARGRTQDEYESLSKFANESLKNLYGLIKGFFPTPSSFIFSLKKNLFIDRNR